MNQYLTDIISRMNDESDQILESGYNSSDTISWKALREAEKIDNENYIPELTEFIDSEKDKKKRDKAYFLLGHIAKNTNNTKATEYLIKRVEKETDKYIVSSLLNRISNLEKPNGIDLQPLINAIENNKWQIRQSAIQSLKNAEDRIAEKALIGILAVSEDQYDLTYANATLNNMGTVKAIPFLEKHLNSKKRDVKGSAKFAIESIKKRAEEESTTANKELW
ncbi:HEAT repeat domain-containing protein [Nonlabens sp. Asnod2-A12]|uniref:HEAT repeat domain-containing protein n=1 Tax=Nonlabens sp. Asnod2-A12 TaxID=3160578 RepID=UPI00386678D5